MEYPYLREHLKVEGARPWGSIQIGLSLEDLGYFILEHPQYNP